MVLIVYFSRATLRSDRLPKSRCTLTIATAMSMHILRRHKAEPLGQSREGLRGARRHAHAAARQYVVAQNLAILVHGQKAKVVGVDVDAVVLRQGKGGLELPRQIGGPVDRLHLVALGAPAGKRLFARLLVSQPDLVVGPSFAGRDGRRAFRPSPSSLREPDCCGLVRAAHHVPLDITAGGERVNWTSLICRIVALRSPLITPWC